MEGRGLTPDKEDRRFPKEIIPEEFICDNIKGFIEHECGRCKYVTKITLSFNHDYLVELNKNLRSDVGVKKRDIIDDFTQYGIKDTKKIYDFMYKNDEGLYLPKIKDKFKLKIPYLAGKRESINKRVEEARILLNKGHTGREVSRRLGFNSQTYFYRFIKEHTGRGVRDFIKESRV